MCSRVTPLLKYLKSALAIIFGIACGSCQRQRTTLWLDEEYAAAYVANDCKVKQQIGNESLKAVPAL